ncbi:hypothetical protein QFZ77_000135 [Paenibacillus sp. V4I3]|nr:hypothetical protein [Paenibacillus sp. V4I3]MDQ0885212.1 hypothetical protein [Paenibacillus sp. V4I9]
MSEKQAIVNKKPTPAHVNHADGIGLTLAYSYVFKINFSITCLTPSSLLLFVT